MREVLGRTHEGRSRSIVEGRADDVADTRASPSRIPEILERHGLSGGDVADLIDPPGRRARQPLLAAILHGPIDADRIDYLQRDAHYSGVAHGAIDASRLLDTVGARSGRLVYEEKGRNAVEGFVVGRSLMYASVYYHKTVRAAEVMAQAAVERARGFPASVRPWLLETDADLLVGLESAGPISSRLVQAIRERRLYKRAQAWRTVPAATLRWLGRVAEDPLARRSLEDRLAARIGGGPGDVLLDVSGIAEGAEERAEWGSLGILEGGRITYPFRAAGLWREVALRPKIPCALSVYVAPRLEAAGSAAWHRPAALDR